ncbi:hypothetical protein COXBURSA331_A1519 [Coxiella burnetii RSA 331]|nr:hypothetical protein COXBURSA331_A1519 [Coxiella burnetii RSA 331]
MKESPASQAFKKQGNCMHINGHRKTTVKNKLWVVRGH